MDQPGTRVEDTRTVHGGKGTRPAGPGGIAYMPKQCVGTVPDGGRCKRTIRQDPVIHTCAAHRGQQT